MDEEAIKVLEEITKRNAGAVDVFCKLIEYLQELAVFDFAMLKQQNILGSDLYDLYQCCNRDMAQLHAAIMQKTGSEMLKKVPGSSFYEDKTHG